jgi:hypothetical protein
VNIRFKLDRLGRETRLILNAVAGLEKYGGGGHGKVYGRAVETAGVLIYLPAPTETPYSRSSSPEGK